MASSVHGLIARPREHQIVRPAGKSKEPACNGSEIIHRATGINAQGAKNPVRSVELPKPFSFHEWVRPLCGEVFPDLPYSPGHTYRSVNSTPSLKTGESPVHVVAQVDRLDK